MPAVVPASIHVVLAVWLIAIALLLVLCLLLLHLHHNRQRSGRGRSRTMDGGTRCSTGQRLWCWRRGYSFWPAWASGRAGEEREQTVLTWTKEKPTQAGRYWYRDPENAEDWEQYDYNAMALVVWHQDGDGGQRGTYLYAEMVDGEALAYPGTLCHPKVDDLDGEWAGPIPVPAEPA